MRRWLLAVTLTSLALVVVVIGLQRGWWTPYPTAADRYDVWGIDVSHHQGVIDWTRVAGARRIRFAYVKATEGGDWTDPRFASNWREARRAGLRVGAYHFFTLCRPGAEQARHFLATVPPDADALPPALDLELGGQCRRPPSREVIVREVRAWLTEVERAGGHRPIVYVTPESYDRFLRGEPLAPTLWFRALRSEPSLAPGHQWSIWQFWPRGRIDGVAVPVDLNVQR